MFMPLVWNASCIKLRANGLRKVVWAISLQFERETMKFAVAMQVLRSLTITVAMSVFFSPRGIAGAFDGKIGLRGAQLAVSTKVTAHWERKIDYEWSIEATASPKALELRKGKTAEIIYILTIERKMMEKRDELELRGLVCVVNRGDEATRGLKIFTLLETRDGARSYERAWRSVTGTEYALSGVRNLNSGESECFEYRLKTPLFEEGVEYRSHATVVIENAAGSMQEHLSSDAYAEIRLPREPQIIAYDKTAVLRSEQWCGEGLWCDKDKSKKDSEIPLFVEHPGQIEYRLPIRNISLDCNRESKIENHVSLVGIDTHHAIEARTSIRVSGGLRRGD